MSFGKPVIGTNIGGIPEVIDHEKNGFLCENENRDDFVEKTASSVKKKELRFKMGILSRKSKTML